VIGSTYHRNTTGNLIIYNLFTANDDDKAFEMVQEHNVNLVLVCPNSPELKLYAKGNSKTFIDRLVEGNIPHWLKPIPAPEESDTLLYEVLNRDSQ